MVLTKTQVQMSHKNLMFPSMIQNSMMYLKDQTMMITKLLRDALFSSPHVIQLLLMPRKELIMLHHLMNLPLLTLPNKKDMYSRKEMLMITALLQISTLVKMSITNF